MYDSTESQEEEPLLRPSFLPIIMYFWVILLIEPVFERYFETYNSTKVSTAFDVGQCH